tara:strand:- start:36858 stop:37148 length:291 start_codon:yes stop_codon:yes gene_type:complete
MPIKKYPSIQVKLYGITDDVFNKAGELLHSFNCKSIGEWNERTCKAFYVSNYKAHNGAKPIYHELDFYIRHKTYYVRMEAVYNVREYGELTQKEEQ